MAVCGGVWRGGGVAGWRLGGVGVQLLAADEVDLRVGARRGLRGRAARLQVQRRVVERRRPPGPAPRPPAPLLHAEARRRAHGARHY